MSAPVGGDPAKPGAWTPEQIAAWNKVADCDHAAFWASNPRDTEDRCGACGAIVRTVPTTGEGWAEHWAEQRADDAAEQRGIRR